MEMAKRVSGKRRIGLPYELARWSGITPQSWVHVGVARDRRWALLVTPAEAPRDAASFAVRDVNRPRRVTEVLQVTMPKPLMEQVGMRPDEWVFVSSLGEGRGMRIMPQSKVTLREKAEPRPRRLVMSVAGGVS